MEKRYIELKVVAEVVNKVFFKVKNNKRKDEFNNGKQHFDASNGIVLYSLDYPSWDGNNRLFLCGVDSRLDDMIIIAFDGDFRKIQQAVDEYNKFALPEFIFRVSIDNIGTSIETLLNKLNQDIKWKESVYDKFKFFASTFLTVDAKYNIDWIQVNDRTLFTEFEYYGADKSLKNARIAVNIGDDDWTVYHLNHVIYKLQF